jgi:hypothetical protein
MLVLVPPVIVAGVHVGPFIPSISLPRSESSSACASSARTIRLAATSAFVPSPGLPAWAAAPSTATSKCKTPQAAFQTRSLLPSTMA